MEGRRRNILKGDCKEAGLYIVKNTVIYMFWTNAKFAVRCAGGSVGGVCLAGPGPAP